MDKRKNKQQKERGWDDVNCQGDSTDSHNMLKRQRQKNSCTNKRVKEHARTFRYHFSRVNEAKVYAQHTKSFERVSSTQVNMINLIDVTLQLKSWTRGSGGILKVSVLWFVRRNKKKKNAEREYAFQRAGKIRFSRVHRRKRKLITLKVKTKMK